MNITDFLNNEYSDASLYLSYRAIPSYIDGLKNGGRKAVYTAKKRNMKESQKVSSFAGAIVDESGYLHGNTSMEGTIVTLSQDYCGSNNLPVFDGIGAFGTRFTNESASARYIFVKPTSYFNLMFKKEDDCNLISQEFEGDSIEPRYYVPTLPLVLINGSTGIGVGFASKILNRSSEYMITCIKNRLEGKRNLDKYFYPYWNGFRGTVEKISDTKWRISGLASISGKKVTITELPIPYTLSDYLSILRTLRDNGIITKFIDYSEDDIYKFEVTLSEEESKKDFNLIFEDLKLSNIITECLTCIDENNSIKEYSNVKEIFNDFYNIKISYMSKRRESEIKRLQTELNELEEIYKFINDAINDKISFKVSKSELEKTVKGLGYTLVQKLISMPLYSLTKEKAKEAKDKFILKEKELNDMIKETPESLWLKDILDLENRIKLKENN